MPSGATTHHLGDQLLAQSAAGDVSAFAEFYDSYSPVVLGLTYEISGNRAVSETLTCEIFVDAWQCAPEYRPDGQSALSWLVDLAHRHAVEWVRSGRADANGGEPASHAARPDDDDNVRSGAKAASQLRCEGWQRLVPEHHEVLTRIYLGACTYREVAEALGIVPDVVNEHLRAGLRELRPPASEAARAPT